MVITDKRKGKGMLGLGNILGGKIIFQDVEEVLQRKVVGIGNGAHVNIPKKHIGKDATITIWKGEEENKKQEEKKNKSK